MTSTVFVDEQTVIRASWLNDVNADVYGVRPVLTGGTGASTAADARTNLGLGNVDNTSDANKPISTATQTALNLKANLDSPTFTNITATGNAVLGDAEASDTHAIKGATTLLANSASPALKVTQTGTGNAFVVEDSASVDSTPVVVTAAGVAVVGHTAQLTDTYVDGWLQIASASGAGASINQAMYNASAGSAPHHIFSRSNTATIGGHGIAASGDDVGYLMWTASDGTQQIRLAQILAQVDGAPGTNDMPGRLVFSTTADGASSPTERMRIDSTGNVGIGSTSLAGFNLRVSANVTGATSAYGIASRGQVQSDVTGSSYSFATFAGFAAFAAASHRHYSAEQGTIATSLTNQFGYEAGTTLTGATNNYGFFSNIAAAANRWNFYAAGTANNAYAGNSSFGKVTAPTSAVDTTSFGTNLVTNTASTYTVLATDGTIVQTTAASTYTLPSAASFTGRILKLLTQFAGTVVSASSNVVPIAGGAAGTAILAATAGKYAVLQSNGTNWLITEAN